jgi:hypothetical protein
LIGETRLGAKERFLELLRQRLNATRPQAQSAAPDAADSAPVPGNAIGQVA